MPYGTAWADLDQTGFVGCGIGVGLGFREPAARVARRARDEP